MRTCEWTALWSHHYDKEIKMAHAQVACITKLNVNSFHEHTTHLGNPPGLWRWTREKSIASIDAGTNTFFVIDPASGPSANLALYAKLIRSLFTQLRRWALNNNLLSPFDWALENNAWLYYKRDEFYLIDNGLSFLSCFVGLKVVNNF